MRRFIRRTLALLVLSVGLLARHSNSNAGDAGNTRHQTVTDPATGAQRNVTSILDYAGGQWHRGRVRVGRTGATKPRNRRRTGNDEDWSTQDTKYQPKYGDLDSQGRATGISITMNWPTREDMKHETDPTSAKGIPPGYTSGMNKGHLLGAQFGGSNADPRNFVPLERHVNSPIMLGIENQVRDYMYANQGKDVTYSVTPTYDGTNPVPTSVSIQLTDSQGKPIQLRDPAGNLVDVVTLPNK